MNERAILSLISDLYLQVTAYQQRVAELEEQLADERARRGEDSSPAQSDAVER